MAAEVARGRELTEFVTNHIFGDEHRDESFTIMHGDRFADHFWGDHGGAAPGFDHLLSIALFGLCHFLDKGVVDVRTFFERTRHLVSVMSDE